jgi:hypothetical protein
MTKENRYQTLLNITIQILVTSDGQNMFFGYCEENKVNVLYFVDRAS